MLFLGFSAGLPILMIFSSLGLWLREAGVQRSAVTYFSWAALGYSFKFIWAPLVDKLPLPILTSMLGRRRGWMIFSQIMIIISICIMALTDPAQGVDSLTMMALGAVLLGFSSATQDIVIDAFRIESAEEKMQATLSATYIAGYRIGMLVSGAGALFIASYFGTSMESYTYESWKYTYLIMAGFMLIGIATTLFRPEPDAGESSGSHSTADYVKFFVMFLVIVACFIASFVTMSNLTSDLSKTLSEALGNRAFSSLIIGTQDCLYQFLSLLLQLKYYPSPEPLIQKWSNKDI